MRMNPLARDCAIRGFLAEDLAQGDVTGEAIFSPSQKSEAVIIAREPVVAAGLEWAAARTFTLLQPKVEILEVAADSRRIKGCETLLHIRGPVLDLLRAERVALNLAMRMCGIATHTARFVEEIKGLPVRLTDTRKTAPGLRLFDKYAVRAGGGSNHRFSLGDGILIKDNHIAACGSIAEAVELVRARAPHTLRMEVEVETLAQVEECLSCHVEIILLDNMDLDTIRETVELVGRRALLEASGGITLETVRAVAETGVDIVSVGDLTHSAPASDLSMRLLA